MKWLIKKNRYKFQRLLNDKIKQRLVKDKTRAINSVLKSVRAGDLGTQLDYWVKKMTKCESKTSARKCCRKDGSAGGETHGSWP